MYMYIVLGIRMIVQYTHTHTHTYMCTHRHVHTQTFITESAVETSVPMSH